MQGRCDIEVAGERFESVGRSSARTPKPQLSTKVRHGQVTTAVAQIVNEGSTFQTADTRRLTTGVTKIPFASTVEQDSDSPAYVAPFEAQRIVLKAGFRQTRRGCLKERIQWTAFSPSAPRVGGHPRMTNQAYSARKVNLIHINSFLKDRDG